MLMFTQDLLHEGSLVSRGIKYTMRTEVMYASAGTRELRAAAAAAAATVAVGAAARSPGDVESDASLPSTPPRPTVPRNPYVCI